MILQPLGPRRRHDTWLWHLSLSVCLGGGRVLWGGARRKRIARAERLLGSSHAPGRICHFPATAHVRSSLLSYMLCCLGEVALGRSSFKGSGVKGGLGGRRATRSSVTSSLRRDSELCQNDKIDSSDFVLSPSDVRWFTLLSVRQCTWHPQDTLMNCRDMLVWLYLEVMAQFWIASGR